MGKVYSSKIKVFGFFAFLLSILFCFGPSGLQAQNKVTGISVDAMQTGTLTYGATSSVTYNVTISSDGAATAGSTTLSLNWGTTPAGASFLPATVTIPAGNTTTTATLTITSAVNTNAGNYSFTVTSSDGSFTSSPTSTFVINKAALTVTATASDKVYDGNPTAAIILSSDKLSGDVVTINYAAANFNTAEVGTSKPVTVTGISITGADAGNYTLASATASATANITVKTLTVTAAASNKMYDGNTTATVSLSSDKLSGDVVTISYAAANFNTAAVGTGKPVSVTGISITGADAGNYTLASATASATADITVKTLTVTAAASDKVYDGNTIAAITLSSDKLSGDVVTISYTAANFNTAAVGTGKPVTVTGISITGAGAGNYTLASATASTTANITVKTLIVTATASNKVYDGNTTATVSLSIDKLSGDVVTISYTAANFNTAAVGTGKPVTATGIDISGDDAANYTLASKTASTTANITRAALTITAKNQTKCAGSVFTFTGNEFTTAGLLNSDAVSSVTLISTGAGAGATAGDYDIVPSAATGTGLGNYAITYKNGTLTVNARPKGVLSGDQTIFTGNPATLSIQVTGPGPISGTLSPGAIPFSGTAPTINVNVSPATTTTYTIASLTNACASVAGDFSGSAIVTVKDHLTISKTITTTPINPGEPVTYQIDFRNENLDAAATNVIVTDTLPAKDIFTYESTTGGGVYDPVNRTIKWTITSLGAGADSTFTVTGKAGSLGTNFGYDPSSYYMGNGGGTFTISNKASISNPSAGTINLVNPVNTDVNQYCGSTLDPDMTTGIINVNSFNEIYYLFTLTNTGNITDSFTLEIDTTFYPGAGGGTKYFNLGNWNITSIYGSTISGTPWLQPGQKFSFLVYIKSDKGYQTGDTSLTNIVSTSYVGGCVKKATTTTIIGDASNATYRPDLQITKTASPTNPTVGSPFNYELTIFNTAASYPAKNGFVVSDTILPELKLINYSTSSPNVSVKLDTIPGPIGDTIILTATKTTEQRNDNPETITITVEPTCYAVPTVYNRAWVNMISFTTGNGKNKISVVDVNPLNDSSSVSVTVASNIMAPTVPWQSVCFNSTATLTASGAGSGFNYKWFDAPTGGNLLQKDGESYTIASLSKPSDSVYVEIYNTSNPVCASARTKVKVTARNYWLGKTSTNWNTGSNWADGFAAPSGGCPDVYVPLQTYQPILSSKTIAIRDIHLMNSGAMATVDGTGKLQISRDIFNTGNGLNVINTGAVEFNGTSTQSISSKMFTDTTISNLIVSNGTGLNVSGLGNSLAITSKLSFGTGNAKLNTGDNVTLKSSKERTASLGEVGSNITVTGKFTVERYINTGTGGHEKKWIFLATPTGYDGSGQTIRNSWMEGGEPNTPVGYGIMLSGPEGSSAWDRLSPAPSIKEYNPATNLWKGASSSDVQLYNERGWMTFIRGDRSVVGTYDPATPTTLRSKGNLLIGPKEFTIPSGEGMFYSIGNPYASAVDMREVKDEKDSIFQNFTVWDPDSTGIYSLGAYAAFTFDGDNYVKIPAGGFTGINNYILSGQAIFVQRDVALKAMNFDEKSKGDTSANTTFFRPMGQKSEPTQMLRSNIYNDLGLIDGTLHIFGKDFSNKVDYQDARKMMNSGINLSIKVDNKLLVVERRQPFNIEDTIFYNLTGAAVGKYNFAFEPNNLAAPGLEAWLEDAYTKERTSVDLDGTTEVNFEVTKDAASKAADRFRMVFKVSPQPASFLNIDAVNDAKDVDVKWEVKQEIRVEKYVVMTSTDGTHFTDLAEVKADGTNSYVAVHKNPSDGYNYYRVRSIDIFGVESFSAVAKIFVGSAEPSLTVFPNPVANGVVHLRLKNYPAGKYLVRLINPAGQVMLVKVFDHAGGNYTEKIPWSYKMAHGDYHLEVRHPDGSVKVIVVRW